MAIASLLSIRSPETGIALPDRGNTFNRIQPGNRDRLTAAESNRRMRVLLESQVVEVKSGEVVLKHADKSFSLRNGAVIVYAGGLLPTQFLKDIGILVETRHGEV